MLEPSEKDKISLHLLLESSEIDNKSASACIK